jgi:hypothetical protein
MRIATWVGGVFGVLTVVPGWADFAGDLASARQRWAERGSDDYTFTISQGCYCPPASLGPITVTVIDGKVGRRGHLDPPVARSSLSITIPFLFDRIDAALRLYPSATFHWEFDPVDGHPTRFEYDDLGIQDEQSVIIVKDFEHL